jgi:hypothetical protein
VYTPKPVQERVIAGHLAGQSSRHLAREEGIDRKTVERILTQPEVAEMRSQYKQRLFSFVPKALDVIDEALSSEDERIRFTAATKLLEALQVMPRVVNGQTDPHLEEVHDPYRVKAQAIAMMLAKSDTYGIPLPEQLAQMKAAVEAAAPNHTAQGKSVKEENNQAISGDPGGLKVS